MATTYILFVQYVTCRNLFLTICFFQAMGAEEIAKSNPVIMAQKVAKI